MDRRLYLALVVTGVVMVAAATSDAELTITGRTTGWITCASALVLHDDGLLIAQDLGSNPEDVEVDGVVFQRDPTTCDDPVNGCEDIFTNGTFTIRLRGEDFPSPAFEPSLDGPGGPEDDFEEILGGLRHRYFSVDPPPEGRALEIQIVGLTGGKPYKIQLLFIEGYHDDPGDRVWDITLDDGTGEVLVFDEFDIISIRESPNNTRAVLATVDFVSSVVGTYALDIRNPRDFNGNGGDMVRSGTMSAFVLRTTESAHIFADGWESGDNAGWSAVVP